jgi:signal transduction histidine kinase
VSQSPPIGKRGAEEGLLPARSPRRLWQVALDEHAVRERLAEQLADALTAEVSVMLFSAQNSVQSWVRLLPITPGGPSASVVQAVPGLLEQLATGRPVRLPEQAWLGATGSADAGGCRLGSVAYWPLSVDARVFGCVMGTRTAGREAFSDRDLQLGQDLADAAALALERQWILSEAQRELKLRRGLAQASRTFAKATANPEQLLAVVAQVCGEVLGALCCVRLVSDDGKWLHAVDAGVYHPRPELRAHFSRVVQQVPQRLGEGLAGAVAVSGEAVVFREAIHAANAATSVEYYCLVHELEAATLMVVPLTSRGQCLGVLTLSRCSGEAPFDDDALELARDLATGAALALENCRLSSTPQRTVALGADFPANLAHELRTPLNAVIGFSALLQMGRAGSLTSTQTEYLGYILKSSRHLLQVINDMLELVKLEAGAFEIRPERVDLRRAVSEVCESLRGLWPDARPVSVQVSAELEEVVTDPQALKRILHDLLSNAQKLTPSPATVTLTLEPTPHQGFSIQLANTLEGNEQRELRRLLREYQQLDVNVGRRHPGAGLGLALTRRLVEAQGGAMSPDGVASSGAPFTVELPRQVAPTGSG